MNGRSYYSPVLLSREYMPESHAWVSKSLRPSPIIRAFRGWGSICCMFTVLNQKSEKLWKSMHAVTINSKFSLPRLMIINNFTMNTVLELHRNNNHLIGDAPMHQKIGESVSWSKLYYIEIYFSWGFINQLCIIHWLHWWYPPINCYCISYGIRM